MNNLVKWFALSILVLTAPARAALDIVITEGVDASRPIAVVPFVWQGPGLAPASISDVVMSDLSRSGTFKPLDVRGIPQPNIHSLDQLTVGAWGNVAAEA